jgi:MraZ protein
VPPWVEVGNSDCEIRKGPVVQSFIGSYVHSVDEKSRLALPKPFREIIGVKRDGREPQMVLARGFNDCIFAFPAEAWPRFDRILREQPMNDPDALSFVREMAGMMRPVSVDTVGRIVLPQLLQERAGIDKGQDVLILGMLWYFEIWNPKRYQNYIQAAEGTYEERAKKLFFG